MASSIYSAFEKLAIRSLIVTDEWILVKCCVLRLYKGLENYFLQLEISSLALVA